MKGRKGATARSSTTPLNLGSFPTPPNGLLQSPVPNAKYDVPVTFCVTVRMARFYRTGGILSWGILSGGILEGDVVLGDTVRRDIGGGCCPGGYCPEGYWRGMLACYRMAHSVEKKHGLGPS